MAAVFAQALNVGLVKIVPADTTTLKTVLTAGAVATVIKNIFVSSTDTSAKDLKVYITRGGVDYLLGMVSIPANSGNTNALPTINLMTSNNLQAAFKMDNDGNKTLELLTGDVLKVAVTATLTTAKEMVVYASGVNY